MEISLWLWTSTSNLQPNAVFETFIANMTFMKDFLFPKLDGGSKVRPMDVDTVDGNWNPIIYDGF